MGLRILRLVAVVAVFLLASPTSSSASASTVDGASALDAATATRCAATIVSISPCLPHVAAVAPPLAGSAPAPTDACCVAFLRAVSPSAAGTGEEGCLCHLLRNPLLLGFPIDASRLAALLPACAAGNAFAAATVEAATLFADACRELKALPELHFMPQSTTRQEISPAAVPEGSVPELMSKPMEAVPPAGSMVVPPAGSMVRSSAEVSSSRGIPIAALILAAAGAVIT